MSWTALTWVVCFVWKIWSTEGHWIRAVCADTQRQDEQRYRGEGLRTISGWKSHTLKLTFRIEAGRKDSLLWSISTDLERHQR